MAVAEAGRERALVRLVDVRKEFPGRDGRAPLLAVNGVTVDIHPGETLGLVGESGSGKTTVARMLVGLETATAGSMHFGEMDLASLSRSGWRDIRRHIQMVFQDPASSLNPRMTVGETLARPLRIHGHAGSTARERRVRELLGMVGLRPEHAQRYPHELSGGQQQRVGIARALAPEPKLAILDEPTSALDVSVQAQILRLLRHLQHELDIAFLFISHNLSVIQYLSHRTAVMYRGRLMELGDTRTIMRVPRHPYTRHLLGSVPRFYGGLPAARPATVVEEPEAGGCPFYARCRNRLVQCGTEFPDLAPVGREQRVACFNPYKEGTQL